MFVIFGALTTLLNWLVYFLMDRFLSTGVWVNQFFAWLSGFLFAFVTNKIFVYQSKEKTPVKVLKEFGLFLASRSFTGIIEITALPFLINIGVRHDLFGITGFIEKIGITCVIVVLNYLLGKLSFKGGKVCKES